ncbi:MAG: hypothetical protein WBB31_17895 [Saprospiraceae bacterium]
MENLPGDIIEKVKNDFRKEDWDLIFSEIENVRHDMRNVGFNQLIRSMISLSQGNSHKFLDFRKNKYLGDPRDIMSLANNINPNSDSGRRPFEIDKLKPGWVSEYWTSDVIIPDSEKQRIYNWLYSNLFTDTQSGLKPKTDGTCTILDKFYLKGESFFEMIMLNNPLSKLPDQVVFERIIYKVLVSINYNTECYWITFNQSFAYHYDIGTLGEYEFENKKLNKIGNGILYPIYSNLFNKDVGNDFDYNYALGTGLISKDFNWFLLFHLNREKKLYFEILAGGALKFRTQIEEMCSAYL